MGFDARLKRLENKMPNDPGLPVRVTMVAPPETEEEAYLRDRGVALTQDERDRYRHIFILLVDAGPDGGPPDPSNPQARFRPN